MAPGPVGNGTVFNPSRGPFTTIAFTYGHDVVSLATPNGCVKSGTVVAKLTIRSRKKHGHVVTKVLKVLFSYDRRHVSTRKRRPFSARFRVTVAPGSKHTISARIYVKTHRRNPKTHRFYAIRTLRSTFRACSS